MFKHPKAAGQEIWKAILFQELEEVEITMETSLSTEMLTQTLIPNTKLVHKALHMEMDKPKLLLDLMMMKTEMELKAIKFSQLTLLALEMQEAREVLKEKEISEPETLMETVMGTPF